MKIDQYYQLQIDNAGPMLLCRF